MINSVTCELIREMSVGGHTDKITSIVYDSDDLKICSGSLQGDVI